MKYLLLATCAFLFATFGYTQYYYNDIVALQQAQQQYEALKNNNIKTVIATSYENDNQPVENFSLEQHISAGAKTITVSSNDPASGAMFTTNRYENNRMVKTTDSTDKVVTTATYQYDASGKLLAIITETDDAFMNSHSQEVHQWHYNGDVPDYMLRIKDNADTTRIDFTYDEQGNVAQESWNKNGRNIENYYYYYNDNHQLTDIVRYNSRAKKMLPDYLFDYNANGRLAQLTQVPAGNDNYMVWKYVYSGSSLKQRELLFNKQNQLVGRIQYQYQ